MDIVGYVWGYSRRIIWLQYSLFCLLALLAYRFFTDGDWRGLAVVAVALLTVGAMMRSTMALHRRLRDGDS